MTTWRVPFALCLIACTQAGAEEALPDPTRPPAGLQSAGAASSPAEAGVLVLQSVLRGTGRRPAAVISGQLVPLGGLVGELRLAQVHERSVQLRGPEGTTTLTLMPEIQKFARPSKTSATTSTTASTATPEPRP
ncbi:MAG: hypothetical protein KF891_23260 [Rhizobacter sp.]|nr:hypothetical protein [Rhizobacter sp.]